MKKVLLTAAALFALTAFSATAEDKNNSYSFLDNFAVEAHFANTYPLGSAGEQLFSCVGFGLGAELTLPKKIKRFDIGFSFRMECLGYAAKGGSNLKGGCDTRLSPGFFMRLPFSVGKFDFAFMPEVFYGIAFKNPRWRDASGLHGVYADQTIGVLPALRFAIPKTPVELDFAPLLMMNLEKSGPVFEAGFRLGAAWRFGEMRGRKK